MPSVVTVWEKIKKTRHFPKASRARGISVTIRRRIRSWRSPTTSCTTGGWSLKGEITDEVAIARARLRIDTRLKLVAKWNPKKYGDKLDLTTREETPPITHEWMIEMMRKSPSFLEQVEKMVVEAKSMPASKATAI